MPNFDLDILERQVEELIQTCRQLRTENDSLRASQKRMAAEHAALIDKTEQTRSRMESMISRLKSMEEEL